jgi:hypothetical protein
VQVGRWGTANATNPDQHIMVFVRSHALGLDEFLLQHRQGGIVGLELEL